MTRNKVKQRIEIIDHLIFKGYIKRSYQFMMKKFRIIYSRHLKFRGKAPVLTSDIYFPPHSSANNKIHFGKYGDLLAVGGDLSPERMICAYKNGIMPLFCDNEPILWWTSEIRCVIYPKDIHIASKMFKIIRKNKFYLTMDQAFQEVILACSELRKGNTWLTSERMAAVCKLHEIGIAHSIEVWQDGNLVGGEYGITMGAYWQSESAFSRVKNMSKLAIIALCLKFKELNFSILDCGGYSSDHIQSLGGVIISRDVFLETLSQSLLAPSPIDNWKNLFENWDFLQAAELHHSSGLHNTRRHFVQY